MGVIHLQQYYGDYYRVIPTIGGLFVANFIVALALALAIIVPVERLPRIGPVLLRLLALAAIGFAAATIALEGAVIVLFALFLALEESTPTLRAQPATLAPRRAARQTRSPEPAN